MQTASKETVNPGLEGVVAATTRLSRVDGQKGELILAGFPVEVLAPVARFEETLYLMWHDVLPDPKVLAGFRAELAGYRALPFETLDLLHAAARKRIPVMDALRMAVASLSVGAETDARHEAATLVAAFPSIVAAYRRMRVGCEPIEPRTDLPHTANYLYMLDGQVPDPERVRSLETYLNTVVDHGLNASTFTARVIISTRSDLISAVTGARGALKGPLHGGAPGPALDMVFEIGEAGKAEPYMRRLLERGERLMGFGHRVYKVRDPRADVLARAAEQFYASGGDRALFELARVVERTAVTLLAEYKPGRRLQTNVEFYTALLLHGLGFGSELFTPTFAIGRVAGWTAHCFEQRSVDRLIRPKAVYEGPTGRRFDPVRQ